GVIFSRFFEDWIPAVLSLEQRGSSLLLWEISPPFFPVWAAHCARGPVWDRPLRGEWDRSCIRVGAGVLTRPPKRFPPLRRGGLWPPASRLSGGRLPLSRGRFPLSGGTGPGQRQLPRLSPQKS